MAITWIWDPEKDRANRGKHGLSLGDGLSALADPLALSVPDPHPSQERWRTIGRAAGIVLLFVVYTDPDVPDGIGRIISVRKATPREKNAYEEGLA